MVGCIPLRRLFSKKIYRQDDIRFDDLAESSTALPDPCEWSHDLGKHAFGEFSFAAVRGNAVVEDYGHLDTGNGTTFIGIYDGHGGHHCAQYTSHHLLGHITRLMQDRGTIDEEVLKNAFAAIEDGFMGVVEREFPVEKAIASNGSCCLVGLLWRNNLYIANAGDSRVVVGVVDRKKKVTPLQLNAEHNTKEESIRNQLQAAHQDDPDIVLKKNGAWRIKGLIQVSKSIGDAYLKRPEFAFDETYPRFHLPSPITQPVITAEPDYSIKILQSKDKFLIFASDGLWDHMSSQEAVSIVRKHPRRAIAKRLIRRVLSRIARSMGGTYEDIKQFQGAERRTIHDDITVIVVFIDKDKRGNASLRQPQLSVRSFNDAVATSEFVAPQANRPSVEASQAQQPSQ